jgi:hypothetical protein
VRQRSVTKPEKIGNNLISAGKIKLGYWSEASKRQQHGMQIMIASKLA